MDLPTVFSDDLHDKKCRRPRHLQIGKGTINKPAFRRDIKLFNLNPQFSQLILNVPEPLILANQMTQRRAKNQSCNSLGTDVLRHDHAIGPGLPQLHFGRDSQPSCNDLQIRIQGPGTERNENIHRITRDHYRDRRGTLDPRMTQRTLEGSIPSMWR